MRSALFAWFAWAVLLAGITKTATGKASNKYKALCSIGTGPGLNAQT